MRLSSLRGIEALCVTIALIFSSFLCVPPSLTRSLAPTQVALRFTNWPINTCVLPPPLHTRLETDVLCAASAPLLALVEWCDRDGVCVA